MSKMTTTTSEKGREIPLFGEQLALLPPAIDVPVQLRLSQRTRRVGLAGVARARALLAEQAARRQRESAQAAHLNPPQAA